MPFLRGRKLCDKKYVVQNANEYVYLRLNQRIDGTKLFVTRKDLSWTGNNFKLVR